MTILVQCLMNCVSLQSMHLSGNLVRAEGLDEIKIILSSSEKVSFNIYQKPFKKEGPPNSDLE